MRESLSATIQKAYDDTTAFFTTLSAKDELRRFVCPAALNGKPGFAIFYTPPISEPALAIIGQNPSNFARNGPWTAEPNEAMLSGTIPGRNSYREDRHYFAETIGSLFGGHEDLLADAVGLNVWHFQASSELAKAAPLLLKRSCEATTRTLVKTIQPKAILCFSRVAFAALTEKRKGRPVHGARKAECLDVAGSRIWYVSHPTSSYTRADAAHDAPIALSEIAQYLATRDSSFRSYPKAKITRPNSGVAMAAALSELRQIENEGTLPTHGD
jgi:hypothetical protein